MNKIKLSLMLLMAMIMVGCAQPEVNTVQVQTVWGKPTKVIRPPGIWTLTTLGDDYYDIALTQDYGETVLNSSTKDNARFTWKIKYTYTLINDDAAIMSHVTQYGIDPEKRKAMLQGTISQLVLKAYEIETKNYPAYDLSENILSIQANVANALKETVKNTCQISFVTLAAEGNPDFADDNIEFAASRVVANQKAVEAATAGLEADKIDQQRQQIQANILKDPALRDIKMLEMQERIERARAEGIKGHNGPLTIIYGNDGKTPVMLNNN